MKRFLLLLMVISLSSASAFAQRQIMGKITDVESKQPVGFATVSIKGTTVGALANDNGEFTISLPAGRSEAVLVFKLLGYDEREVSVTTTMGRINVQLMKNSVAIGDIVVTGIQSFKKETFTGSTIKISADDMELAGVTDISRMLEGKVAGVSLQNVSSTFGAAPKVRIRGATSIQGENKPLWVVDGIVLEDVISISNDQLSSGDPTTLLGSSVAGINATDIETFDILKDAAATALYGARAMNGVIVITTKKGKEGPARVSYSGNFTVRTKPRYENFDIMNSADQMSVFSELNNKGIFDIGMLNNSNYGPYGLMYKYLSKPNPETGNTLPNTAEARAKFLYPYAKANTDWFDQLYTNKLIQEHTLSVTFGNEKSSSYASVGFLHDAGATIADKVNRYTANFRNDTRLSDKISLGMQVVGSLRTQKVPGSFSRDLDVVRGDYSRNFDINPFSYSSFAARSFRPYNANGDLEFVQKNYAPFNILHELDNNTIDLNVADIKAQMEFNYDIIEGLKFNFLGAVRYVNSTQDHKIRPSSNVAQAYRAAGNSTIREKNPYLWRDIEDATVIEGSVVLPHGGFLINKTNELLNYNFRTSLAYSKVWMGQYMHEFNAFGGMEVKSADRKVTENSLIGYMFDGSETITDANYYKMLEQRHTPAGESFNTFDRFTAFYVNLDYSFDRRYSVMATGRYDGSNSLGSGSGARWLPTWTVSAKWNIMNEAFMEDVNVVDMMSLRMSYGLNATMPSVVNSKAIFYASSSYAPGYSQKQIVLDRLADKDLTWEKSYQLNVGFDLSMFRGRANLYVDYFNRKSFDLIDLMVTSGVGGFMYKYGNYADLDSHGMDITIGGVPIKKKDWNLNLNFTFGYSTNKIKNAKNTPALYELVRGEGGNKNNYAVNSLFSIPFAGLHPSTGYPLFYQPDGSIDFDANMQGLNTDYLKHEGNIDPKYTGGLNATLRWKDISANIFFSYQWGNVVRLDPIFRSSLSDMDALSNAYKNRWVMTGDELNTNIPSIPDPISETVHGLKNVYPYTNYNYSDVRVAKGDFIRLKSVSLSYNLPAKWLASTKVFKTASVRVTGKDLWLLYSDKALNGQDPEFFNTGGVAMPSMPQVIFTLSMGF